MISKTQAITEFLNTQPCKIDIYRPCMEVQVNVKAGKDRVERDKGRSPVWTDGHDEWSSFRIPFNAAGKEGDPHYRDSLLEFELSDHVESIGCTGWNWQEGISEWVGFDFDSITNHAKGLTDFELDDLRDRVRGIPWCELRRSKSGKGFHLYVRLEPAIPTANHAEHAGLARAILSNLASLLKFDFKSKVDTCGGVLWIWHSEASATKRSFQVISNSKNPLSSVPANWRDYIKEKRSSGYRRFVDESKEDLVSRTKKAKLDAEHQKLLFWFGRHNFQWWWDEDNSMLVCHTSDLIKAHTELGLRGVFYTDATGKDKPNDHNCFMFPLRGGKWRAFRYSSGVKEHKYWTTSPSGWTTCLYNCLPTLSSSCKLSGGLKTKKGSFIFKKGSEASLALKSLGESTHIPDAYQDREVTIAPGKTDGELILSMPREETDQPPPDWYAARGPTWEKVIETTTETVEVDPPDGIVRHVVDGVNSGWCVKSRGDWIPKAKDDIKDVLISCGYQRSEIPIVLGQAVQDHWDIVSIPFEKEYPGDRTWNKKSAQLAYEPKLGRHPTWDLLLNHVGRNLVLDSWCQNNGLLTGGDYLRCLVASLFRYPHEPLPYIFVYGNQNTGKSLLHEALSLLFKDGLGYCRADKTLTSAEGFNGELVGAVLCAIEEVDVSKSSRAYDRIKDYVTSRNLLIREMRKNAYTVPNTTHWIQVANDPSYCPVLPGDTRITVIYVSPFEGAEIPKPAFINRLLDEAAYFLHTVMNLEIPDSPSRLRLPVINSDLKEEIQDTNRNKAEEFVAEHCIETPGTVIAAKTLYNVFCGYLDGSEKLHWSKDVFLRHLPVGVFPKGKYGGTGELTVGNLTVVDKPDYSSRKKNVAFVRSEGRLK